METVKADEEGLERTAVILNGGGVAVIPTDTVYGLAASASHPAAVERLYSIKGRDSRKPIALLCADFAAAERFVGGISGAARDLAEKHWPGGFTLVYKGEGLRVPDYGWTRRLIAKCGGVLRVTSANLSGRRPATDAIFALDEIGLSTDIIVDDGISPGGEASTVAAVSPEGEIKVLRQGAIVL